MSTKSRKIKAAIRRNNREMRQDPFLLISRREDWPRKTYHIQVGEKMTDEELGDVVRKMQRKPYNGSTPDIPFFGDEYANALKYGSEKVMEDWNLPTKDQ